MKQVRLLANLLYYVTRLLAILILATAVYAAIALISKSQNFIEISNDTFTIFLPFTKSAFLLGDYSSTYISLALGTVTLYGIFMWLLSGVFKTFSQTKLFTPKGIANLSAFYIYNMVIPVMVIIALAVAQQPINDAFIIGFLHVMIGVFAFFMAAIFKQGVLLQEEQDLTL